MYIKKHKYLEFSKHLVSGNCGTPVASSPHQLSDQIDIYKNCTWCNYAKLLDYTIHVESKHNQVTHVTGWL